MTVDASPAAVAQHCKLLAGEPLARQLLSNVIPVKHEKYQTNFPEISFDSDTKLGPQKRPENDEKLRENATERDEKCGDGWA